MAWRCSGNSNTELLANMKSSGLIKSNLVFQAMTKVDRANYVRSSSIREAYSDSPQSIGFGATVSAPHMHAHAAEALLPYLQRGNKVLDIGSGSGYTMAIFWHLVKREDEKLHVSSQVVGIDHITELVKLADSNLRKDGLSDAVDAGWVKLIDGDGRQGHEEAGPYSAIHVGAAAPTIPQTLVDQLAKPGRMFIPVEDASGYGQDIWHVDKDVEGRVTKEKQFGVMYVPLTDRAKQWK